MVAESNATINGTAQAMTAAVAGATSTVAADTFYLKLTVTPHTANIAMSSSDGKTYGVVANKLVKANENADGTVLVDYFTVTASFSSVNNADTALLPEEVAQIKAGSHEFDIDHNTGTRIRLAVANSAPAVSGTTLGLDGVKIKVTWTNASEDCTFEIHDGTDYVTYGTGSGEKQLYYSIAGQLAVEGDSGKTGGTGLSVGDDLASSFIDTNYLGQDATAESTFTGDPFKLVIA